MLRGESTIVAEIDRSSIALSDDLQLTLTIEGPAPIHVTLPKSILHADAAVFWRIKGNSPPEMKELGAGRARWQQMFRLSPFEAGKRIPLALADFSLQVGTEMEQSVKWKDCASIEVTTSIASPESEALRPVTEIEPAPPAPPESPDRFGIGLVLIVVVVLFAVAIALILLRRRRSCAEGQIYNAEWALAKLQEIAPSAGVADARRRLPQLADILRRFVEYRFQLPALRRTTPELLEQLHSLDANIPWEKLDQLLNACDRAKFASDFLDGPDFTEYAELHEWAVQFIRSFLSVPSAL